MTIEAILSSIDEQISKLQQARDVLSGGITPSATSGKKGPGRPKKVAFASSAETGSAGKKRVMSEEARARIAAAQKKRWAAVRKASK